MTTVSPTGGVAGRSEPGSGRASPVALLTAGSAAGLILVELVAVALGLSWSMTGLLDLGATFFYGSFAAEVALSAYLAVLFFIQALAVERAWAGGEVDPSSAGR
jgi:hypothetical protein